MTYNKKKEENLVGKNFEYYGNNNLNKSEISNNNISNNNISYSNYTILNNNEGLPINRPLTPLNSTTNSQMVNTLNINKSYASKMKNIIPTKKNNEFYNEKISVLKNTSDVFKKRDLIQRTPQRGNMEEDE